MIASHQEPAEPWKESREDFGVRLRSICQASATAATCKAFVGSCHKVYLADREGDRLSP